MRYHRTKLLCAILSVAMLFSATDFTVLAAENSSEMAVWTQENTKENLEEAPNIEDTESEPGEGTDQAENTQSDQGQEKEGASSDEDNNGEEEQAPSEGNQSGEEAETPSDEDGSELPVDQETVSGNEVDQETVSGNEVDQETVSGNEISKKTVSGNKVKAVQSIKKAAKSTFTYTYAGTGEVSRIQWLHELTTVFEMSVDENNYPDNYYSDLDSSSEYYYDAMLATEFGLVDVEAGGELRPDEPATREFAAHTLNLCLGFQLENPDYTFSESGQVTYPDDIQVAINRGWLAASDGSFLPDNAVMAEDVTRMLTDAGQVRETESIDSDHENSYEFKEDVIVLSGATAVLTGDDEITITNCTTQLETGDKFAIIQDDLPIVKRVVSVETSDGSMVVRTESVDFDEAFISLDVQGTVTADLSQTQVSDSDMAIKYIVGGTEENAWEDGTKYDNAIQAKSYGIDAVEIVKSYDIPQAVREEFQIADGVKATIECKISNVTGIPKVDMLAQEAFLKVNGTVTFSCNVSLDVLEAMGVAPSIQLARIPLSLGGYISVTLDLTFYGEVTFSMVQDFSIGVQYSGSDGFRAVKDFQKREFTIQAHTEISAGVTMSAGIDWMVIKGSIYGKAGAKAELDSETYTDGKQPTRCTHTNAWLYASVGYSVKILGQSKDDSIDIWNKKNSPVRVSYHYEDGIPVMKCTREEQEGSGNTRWKYYTPINSKYGYNGASSGTDSSGNPYTIFEYELNDKNEATITKYNGNVSALHIPSTLDGYTVVGVGSAVFKNNKQLRVVVIPDSVTKIENNAFRDCSNLSNITLSRNLETLDYSAFQGCTPLTAIEIPKSLKKASKWNDTGGVFAECPNLKTVTFEAGTTEIAENLFANCPGIESIDIPDTVTIIEEYAFYNCTNLSNVRIGNFVTEIENDAFRECAQIKEIVIPDSVIKIGYSAFQECRRITEIVIPDSVTKIENNAFRDCSNLSNITLSRNLETLDYSAFQGCTPLTAIEIPKSLKKASKWNDTGGVFAECPNLKTVTFEAGTTEIAENLFANCPGIESIDIPDTVTIIEEYAFYNCTNLSNVRIGNFVTEIENNAFQECPQITEIVIPDSVTKIGNNAFKDCSSLSEIKLSGNLETLDYSAFQGCTPLTAIEIPKSLKQAQKWNNTGGVFAECPNLKTVSFEAGTTEIAANLFANCPGIESIDIPETVTIIEEYAFYNCEKLLHVNVPNRVTEIGESAFKESASLTNVIMSESLTKIGNYAFQNCISLTEITIPASVNKMGTYLFDGCSSLEKAVLQNELTVIPANSFSDCSKLKLVEMPDSYTTIKQNAFQNCSALNSITWSKELIAIETRAFENTGMETVTLPDKLSTVGSYAFYNCDLLESIAFPDSVTSIGTYVLSNCEKLSDVQLSAGLTEIPKYAFDLCPSLAKMILPYRITTVASNAFTNCTSLTEITIPRAVSSIGSNAVSYPTRMTVYGISGTYAETWANSVGAAFVEREVKATEVTLGQEAVTVNKGQKATLVLTVTPSDFTDEVVWRSTDETIATIDDMGVVTGKALGEATISVLVGDVDATCKVIVVQPVTSITLNKSSLSLDAFESERLTAMVNPSTAQNKAVAWSSSDEEIAVVDENGLVTAVAKGEAVITVTAQDGSGVSKTCKVTVTGNGYLCSTVSELESSHNYTVNSRDSWLYTREGAGQLFVTFDERTEVENEFDFIYLYDGWGEQIGEYTGTALAGKTIRIPGDTVRITLVSDKAGTKWGFKVTAIRTENENPDQPENPDDSEGVLPEDIPEGGIPQGLWISAISEQEYTGKAIKPEVRVYNGSKRLKAGKDYTITYKNNVQAAQASGTKTPTVTVKGKGNYSGTETAEFSILAKNISDISVIKTFTDGYALPTNNKNPKLVFSAKYNNKTLKANKDYTLTVKNSDGMLVSLYNTIGVYKVVVDGKGNFTGSEELTFEVTDKTPVSKLKVNSIAALEYTGNPLTPVPIVKDKNTVLSEETDYTLTYRNNVEVGSASVLITGKGNYLGTRTVTFKIKGRPMNKVKVKSFVKTFVYTGNAVNQSQAMTLTYGKNDEKLNEGVDYQTSYSNNTNAGTATVTFTGMGKYTGVLKKTYKIQAYRLDRDLENRIECAQEDIEISYSKGGAKPHIKLYDGMKLLAEGTDYTLSYRNNNTVASASAQKAPIITVKGKGNYYGVWTQKIPFTITTKNIAEVVVTSPDAAANSKAGKFKSTPVLKDTDGKKLSAGKDYSKSYRYTYKDETLVTDKSLNSQIVRKAGEAVGEADIIPAKTILCVTVAAKEGGNYKGTVTATYRVVQTLINKAKITVKNPEMSNKNLFAYTGKPIKIEKKNLIVKVGGVELTEDQYEILNDTYKNNLNKGTGTVQIKGVGDYGGIATVKFKIGAKNFRWFFR